MSSARWIATWKIDRTRAASGHSYGVKDLLAARKHLTTWGAKPHMLQVSTTTPLWIVTGSARLIGKLSMIELAGGGDYRTAAASLTGPGLNPWIPRAGAEDVAARALRLRRPGDVRDHPNLGLDSDARCVLRHYRPASHLWIGQPAWRDGAFLDAG